jgi:Rod binding domain-containing protein
MSGLEGLTNPAKHLNPLDAVGAPVRNLPNSTSSDRKLRKAVKDFEAVLLTKLLEEMKRTIPDSGLLTTGISKQIQDLFWLYLAQDLAEKGGLGICKDLYREFGGTNDAKTAGRVMELVR